MPGGGRRLRGAGGGGAGRAGRAALVVGSAGHRALLLALPHRLPPARLRDRGESGPRRGGAGRVGAGQPGAEGGQDGARPPRGAPAGGHCQLPEALFQTSRGAGGCRMNGGGCGRCCWVKARVLGVEGRRCKMWRGHVGS